MKVRDVIKIVEADGWCYVGSKGDHRQYEHPVKRGKVAIAGHSSDEMRPKTKGRIRFMSIGEQIYSISEIRDEITRLPEHFDQESGAVTVTDHGKPVMAILPWQLYDSLIETIEILSDDELMADIRQAAQDMEEGKGRPWEEVVKDLGW